MAKKGVTGDGLKKAKKKLAKTRLKLEVAEERYAQVRERGNQGIERARLQAAEWQAEAGERVQRRAGAVERAEIRVRESTRAAAGEVSGAEAGDSTGGDGANAGVAGNKTTDLTSRELEALRVLKELNGNGSIRAQDWRAATGMPGSTFARVRSILLEHGFVIAQGALNQRARYAVTDSGTSMTSLPTKAE